MYVRYTDLDYIKDSQSLINSVLCSSAVPVLFLPKYCEGKRKIDGGVSFNLDIEGAISLCKQIGFAKESDMIMDVIAL